MKRVWIALCVVMACLAGGLVAAQPSQPAQVASGVGRTVDVGRTGFAVKRPVFASACPRGCPWGELGEFVREAMAPLGYDVVLCRNCNRADGPRLVSTHASPPRLRPDEAALGTVERFDAPVDFGVTEAGMLSWAYRGRLLFAGEPPRRNLRLIAHIEDPTYLLVAVPAASPVRSLGEIAAQRRPVRILSDLSPASLAVLSHYGITRQSVEQRGGSMKMAIGADLTQPFDVVISVLASPAFNPESVHWSLLAARTPLRFLDLPPPLLDELAADFDMERVVVRYGLLPGLDHAMPTVARSGHAIFGTADMPDQAAYDAARAIDAAHDRLKWFIRPYSYDPRTVWKNGPVPLHPGAARYYRELAVCCRPETSSVAGFSRSEQDQ